MLLQGGAELRVRKLRHVLLGVIDPRGQVGVHALQRGLYAADALGKPPVQRGFCQRGALPPVGGDDLHDRLRLRQRHTPMLQCAAGKFAGRGGFSARQQQRFQQTVRHGGAAVNRQFNDVFARVGVRCAEKQRHGFVHFGTAQGVMPEQRRVPAGVQHGFLTMQRHKYLAYDGVGFRSGNAHHGNAARTRGRCQRADGLVHTIHSCDAPLKKHTLTL